MNLQGWSRVLSFVLVAGLAFWFTIENAAQRVRVDFLLFEIRISVPLLVFLSVLAGMLAVFLVGLRADLRTRRALERYRGGVSPGFGAGPRGGFAAGPRWEGDEGRGSERAGGARPTARADASREAEATGRQADVPAEASAGDADRSADPRPEAPERSR